MNFWKAFPLTVASLALLDFLWLGLLMKNFMKRQLDGLARFEGGQFVPVLWSATLVYLVMSLTLVLFGTARVGETASALTAAAWGGLLGFCVYATYDFTNHATLPRWPLPFMAVDIFWGATQFAIVAALLQTLRPYLK